MLMSQCPCCCVPSVVSDSVRPHRRQPTRLPRPWDSPGKNTGMLAISFSTARKWKVKMKSLSRVQLWVTPRTAAHQAPPSMGFSRQEDCSGHHCLPPVLLDVCLFQLSVCSSWLAVIHAHCLSFFKTYNHHGGNYTLASIFFLKNFSYLNLTILNSPRMLIFNTF